MRFLTFLLVIAVCFLTYERFYKKQSPTQAHSLWVDTNESIPEITYDVVSFDSNYQDYTPQAPPVKDIQIWNSDYYGTMKNSEETGKHVLCFVGSSNCPPCEKMKQELRSNNDINKYLLVSIHSTSDKDLVEKFKVKQFPTTFIISPEYKITHKLVGYKTESELLTCLEKSTCYCCDNPDCKCGENCHCEKCQCKKEEVKVKHLPQYQYVSYTPQIHHSTLPVINQQYSSIPQQQTVYYNSIPYQPSLVNYSNVSYQPVTSLPTQNYYYQQQYQNFQPQQSYHSVGGRFGGTAVSMANC